MTKVRCEHCGRWYAIRYPKGGDGSAWFPWKHYIVEENGKKKVCPGTYMLTEEIE